MGWYLGVLRKYVDFTGRARRTEFWTFTIINMIISLLLSILESMLGIGLIAGTYALAVLLPSLAVGVRRLHDTGRRGWWLLISLIPLVSLVVASWWLLIVLLPVIGLLLLIVLIVFFVQDSQPGDNAFGANPKGVRAAGATAAA